MVAFATYQDLEALLNRVFTVPERAWITTLLEAASTYLRDDIIGFQVYPQSTVTFNAWPENGEIVLPQQPVIEVVGVERDAVAIDFVYRDGVVFVDGTTPVDIEFTYGYAVAPEDLKRWTCVLVSQVLLSLELKLGLSVGGLSSVALDDFRVAFANAGEDTGMQLSDKNIQLLRDRYTSRVFVGGMR